MLFIDICIRVTYMYVYMYINCKLVESTSVSSQFFCIPIFLVGVWGASKIEFLSSAATLHAYVTFTLASLLHRGRYSNGGHADVIWYCLLDRCGLSHTGNHTIRHLDVVTSRQESR